MQKAVLDFAFKVKGNGCYFFIYFRGLLDLEQVVQQFLLMAVKLPSLEFKTKRNGRSDDVLEVVRNS